MPVHPAFLIFCLFPESSCPLHLSFHISSLSSRLASFSSYVSTNLLLPCCIFLNVFLYYEALPSIHSRSTWLLSTSSRRSGLIMLSAFPCTSSSPPSPSSLKPPPSQNAPASTIRLDPSRRAVLQPSEDASPPPLPPPPPLNETHEREHLRFDESCYDDAIRARRERINQLREEIMLEKLIKASERCGHEQVMDVVQAVDDSEEDGEEENEKYEDKGLVEALDQLFDSKPTNMYRSIFDNECFATAEELHRHISRVLHERYGHCEGEKEENDPRWDDEDEERKHVAGRSKGRTPSSLGRGGARKRCGKRSLSQSLALLPDKGALRSKHEMQQEIYLPQEFVPELHLALLSRFRPSH
eukprot:767778-Hanusia_phi.AAC.2